MYKLPFNLKLKQIYMYPHRPQTFQTTKVNLYIYLNISLWFECFVVGLVCLVCSTEFQTDLPPRPTSMNNFRLANLKKGF